MPASWSFFISGLMSELKLAVPWGHIAAKIWGPQQGSPVLCLHGWLDNANSFDRLIPLLPKGGPRAEGEPRTRRQDFGRMRRGDG